MLQLIRRTGGSLPFYQCRRAFATNSSDALLDDKFLEKKMLAMDQIRTSHPFNNVPINIAEKVGKNLHLKRNHPLNILKTLVEGYFDKMHEEQGEPKFTFLDNLSPIVSTKSCFDDLLTPKDHVSRRPTDTYYVNDSTLLRTHTSCHQVPMMQKGLQSFLVTGDVYRRDEIDSSHYPVFHQIEGVRVFPELTKNALSREEQVVFVKNNLKYTIEGMVRSLFGDVEMRWIDAYFPFTEPSLELEIFFNGEWLEVMGAGVIRQEIMRNSGNGEHPGWALGCGLERLAMVLFDIPDIRLFWSEDDRFISQFEHGKITKFKPYSKYPPCYKDLSFWTGDRFHENDLCELVREIAGDTVEQVSLIDEFQHPTNGRVSKCYRIFFRSMDRNLTNEEVDQHQVIASCEPMFP